MHTELWNKKAFALCLTEMIGDRDLIDISTSTGITVGRLFRFSRGTSKTIMRLHELEKLVKVSCIETSVNDLVKIMYSKENV